MFGATSATKKASSNSLVALMTSSFLKQHYWTGLESLRGGHRGFDWWSWCSFSELLCKGGVGAAEEREE